MPVEIMLLPRWFPFHLDKVSYWARTVLVPLMVLNALKPRARQSAQGIGIAELFAHAAGGRPALAERRASDVALGADFRRHRPNVARVTSPIFRGDAQAGDRHAPSNFVTERLNGEDGLGAIFPAMVNALLMFDALGYAADDPNGPHGAGRDRQIASGQGRRSLLPALPVAGVGYGARRPHAARSREAKCANGGRCRACNGCSRCRCSISVATGPPRVPSIRPGGWAFQYANPHYPDLDDTAVVVMAMDRASARMPEQTPAHSDSDRSRARNGSLACRARMAAGPRSMPTTNITI